MAVPTLTLLGAARTVTGSKFLIETDRARVLVDCGLFQGTKPLRRKNWSPFPLDPASIDAVVVSHAHLDHVGYLPRLCNQGFTRSIWASESTGRLGELVLADSGRIQEADAEHANRKGYSKHRPALPLYTEDDALRAALQFRVAPWNTPTEVAEGISIRLLRAGHILGSATVMVDFHDGTPSVHFSGDLGRPHHPLLLPPDPCPPAGTTVVESTYGDREHYEVDGTAALGSLIARTADRGGTVVIPAFAVDRTEVILHALRTLTESGTIPPIPIYLDSPMARSALGFYLRAIAEGHYEIRPDVRGHPEVLDPGDLRVTESVEESKAINSVPPPLVVISASGMATGGRVLHHLKRILGDPNSAVALVGYQAVGTRGWRLLQGEPEIKIHGRFWPVRAEIASIDAFSAHADRSELLDWLATADATPERMVAVHGDPEAEESLAAGVRQRLEASLLTPEEGAVIPLR